MNEPMPRATGLDARFDDELAAAIPGWRRENAFDLPEEKRKEATGEAEKRQQSAQEQ